MNEITKQILAELELTQHEFWNISKETAVFISMLIKIKRPEHILEIGTSNGYSSMWIADALQENGMGHLHTIEFWDKRQNIAIENLKKAGLYKYVTPLQGSAMDILPTIDFVPDMIFIDANKSEYIKYFELFKDRLKKGSIILADNVLSHAEKVKPFMDEISGDNHYQSLTLNLPAGLLFATKIA